MITGECQHCVSMEYGTGAGREGIRTSAGVAAIISAASTISAARPAVAETLASKASVPTATAGLEAKSIVADTSVLVLVCFSLAPFRANLVYVTEQLDEFLRSVAHCRSYVRQCGNHMRRNVPFRP